MMTLGVSLTSIITPTLARLSLLIINSNLQYHKLN